MWAMMPIVVYGVEGDTVYIADRSRQPLTVPLPGGGREHNSFAVWDGSAWHPTMGSHRTDQLSVVTVEHDTTVQVYTVGDFALLGASPQHRIARYDTCRCATDATTSRTSPRPSCASSPRGSTGRSRD